MAELGEREFQDAAQAFGLENCVMLLSDTGNIEEKASFDGDNQVTFGFT